MSNQKHLGQYFTKNVDLQKKVYEFIYNNPETILEPSVGRGDLVKYITKFNSKIKFQCWKNGIMSFALLPISTFLLWLT